MIETNLREPYQRFFIEPLIRLKAFKKIHPIALTCAAFLSGLAILPLLVFGLSTLAFVFLVISGFLDTLDGSVARLYNRSSSKGAALDIVSDRVVEFAIILGLFYVDSEVRAVPALLMLGTILICITSFLIVGMFTKNETEKSFYYHPGLIERAEAFIFFAVMMLVPEGFSTLAYIFSFLVFLTALIHMTQFLKKN